MKMNKGIMLKLFQYLSAFVLFIVLIFLLVQTVFLDDFYRMIKRREVRLSADFLIENLEDIALEDYILSQYFREDICIRVVSADGSIIYSSGKQRNCYFSKMSDIEIQNLYQEMIRQTDSEKFEIVEDYRFGDGFSKPEKKEKRSNIPKFSKPERLIYMKVSESKGVLVLIDAMLTPMSATKSVLRIQILYVTMLLILAAAILAYILAKKIAQPIIDINRSAKNLISGGYDVEFSPKTYREIVELNDTLKQTSYELGKAERLKRELIANISHDLRTPLTMIQGYAEVMRDLPNENTKENVQVIIDEASRLSRLVNDILAISKVSDGQSMRVEEFCITELVREIIFRCGKLMSNEKYSFEFESEREVKVSGDESKIAQAIYNLLGNAVSHTGEDGKIFVKQEIFNHDVPTVRISVADTGKGIEPQYLEDIWERYYKVEQVHVRSDIGSGLGLSIVKEIMQMHGGTCGVDSELGKGSVFWIEIPYQAVLSDSES